VTCNSTEHFYHVHTITTRHKLVGKGGKTLIVVDAEVYDSFPCSDPAMTLAVLD
jgi:hypothetical protein